MHVLFFCMSAKKRLWLNLYFFSRSEHCLVGLILNKYIKSIVVHCIQVCFIIVLCVVTMTSSLVNIGLEKENTYIKNTSSKNEYYKTF